MKNFIQPGNVLTIVAAAAIESGAGILIGAAGGVVGVACNKAAIGEAIEVAVEGVFEVTKLTADDVAVGDFLYWDNTNKRLTKTATANTLAGIAVEAAGTSSTTVKVRLNGTAKGAAA